MKTIKPLTPAVAKKRVAAGALFLNKKTRSTKKWRKQINLETLDIASSCDCVLGQVFGSYSEGCDRLNIDYPVRLKYGFTVNIKTKTFDKDTEILRKVWTKELSEK
jgi:hypothetical protein